MLKYSPSNKSGKYLCQKGKFDEEVSAKTILGTGKLMVNEVN